MSAQAEAGNVKLIRGLWNDEFLRVLENFPTAKHDDEVDGLSGAYQTIGQSSGAFDSEAIRELPNFAGRREELVVEAERLRPEDF